jgi:hypothetical protein
LLYSTQVDFCEFTFLRFPYLLFAFRSPDKRERRSKVLQVRW